jgi:predicted RNase H-like HicB family nuclease
MRQVLIYPGEDGWFVAECPSLPGCISQGRTRPEAIANIREAIDLMVEDLQEQGEPVPADMLEAVLVVV